MPLLLPTLARRPFPPLEGLLGQHSPVLEKLLAVDQLRNVCAQLRPESGECVFDHIMRILEVSYRVDGESLSRVPRKGGALVVANHPFGILEGILLGAMLSRIRPDVKILANHLLGSISGLNGRLIAINPFEGSGNRLDMNVRGLRKAVEWLKGGGMLVTFPAGEVSHWNLRERGVQDPPWSPAMARLARIANTPVVPVYFGGSNSVPFYMLGMVHPLLRTARLPQELLNKQGKCFEVKIGGVIPAAQMTAARSDAEAIGYVRGRTYLLSLRSQPATDSGFKPQMQTSGVHATGACSEWLQREIARLPEIQKLDENKDYCVYIADAGQIPTLLREIGRLREITFRAAGEGTGRDRDLDAFDSYYQHLFLWHKQNQEIAGAYRLGKTSDILRSRGVKGLYTSSLFHFDARFFDRIGPAMELGRSFIRPEYQKQYLPLLLLWKGVLQQVAREGDTPVLFGAVSISRHYSNCSRRLLAAFCANHQPQELKRLVRPRHPFRTDHSHRSIAGFCRDLESISAAIVDLESDRKGVPILLKQYWKLGGRVVDFSVDPNFAGCLDGLLVLDLRQTEPQLLRRFLPDWDGCRMRAAAD